MTRAYLYSLYAVGLAVAATALGLRGDLRAAGLLFVVTLALLVASFWAQDRATVGRPLRGVAWMNAVALVAIGFVFGRCLP